MLLIFIKQTHISIYINLNKRVGNNKKFILIVFFIIFEFVPLKPLFGLIGESMHRL